MKSQFERSQMQDAGDIKDDNSFVNDTFSAMCNVTRYVQLNLTDIKKSDLLTHMFYKEKHAMVNFKNLCPFLPNCNRFFVSLRGVEVDETRRVLSSEKLVKFLVEISDDADSNVR